MTEGIGCPLFWMVRLLKEREIRVVERLGKRVVKLWAHAPIKGEKL